MLVRVSVQWQGGGRPSGDLGYPTDRPQVGAKKIDKGAKPRIPASSLPNSTGLPWMMGRWLDTHLARHRQLYNVNLPVAQLLLLEKWKVEP